MNSAMGLLGRSLRLMKVGSFCWGLWDIFICLGCRLPSSGCCNPLAKFSKFSTLLAVPVFSLSFPGLRLNFLSGLELCLGEVEAEAGAVAEAGAGVLVLIPDPNNSVRGLEFVLERAREGSLIKLL